MEILGISLLLYSMRFCSYSSVLSCLSHCMSKELFFVLSIPMIINLQVHIPLWKKKICILLVLLMLILFLHLKYMCSMIYIYPYDIHGHLVENKANLLTSTITTETCEQLVEPHFQLTYFQSRLRQKMFRPLRLPSLFILTIPTLLNIFPILLEKTILQQRSI